MGPSIRIDGDSHSGSNPAICTNASMGPSIRIDGDVSGVGLRETGLRASMGPSIRIDGDLVTLLPNGGWWTQLQWGRRFASTETADATDTGSK